MKLMVSFYLCFASFHRYQVHVTFPVLTKSTTYSHALDYHKVYNSSSNFVSLCNNVFFDHLFKNSPLSTYMSIEVLLLNHVFSTQQCLVESFLFCHWPSWLWRVYLYYDDDIATLKFDWNSKYPLICLVHLFQKCCDIWMQDKYRY